MFTVYNYQVKIIIFLTSFEVINLGLKEIVLRVGF